MSLLLLLATSLCVRSDNVYLAASNPGPPSLVSSFNSPENWTNALAPSAGHTYHTNGYYLRTPRSGAAHHFAGDRLIIGSRRLPMPDASQPGALLLSSNVATTLTIDDLVLDGGYLSNFGNGSVTQTVEGHLLVTSAGGYLWANNGTLSLGSTVSLAGELKLVGHHNNHSLTFLDDVSFGASGSLRLQTLSASFDSGGGNLDNTHLVQGEQSTFTFGLAASPIPRITIETGKKGEGRGARSVTFNGRFVFNLSLPHDAIGIDGWQIVNNEANATILYGTGFTIEGFTTTGDGQWISSDGRWSYHQSNHTLTAASVPEPASLTLLSLLLGGAAFLRFRKTSLSL